MSNTITSLVLAALTVLSAVAAGVALYRLFHPRRPSATDRLLTTLVALTTLGCGAVFVALWAIHGKWQPLRAHVDGLLLITTLLGAAILFVLTRRRLFGLSAFALPILTLLLAWSICAAKWTYRPFNIESLHPVWMGLHLAGVYLGTLGAGVAAVAGAMFLYVESRLKHKKDLAAMGRLASLETLENIIVRGATLGFVLLTLGAVSGAVITAEDHALLAEGYWVKIVIAVAAWALYALLMNVRYTATFRGARAAWLSIVGLLLLLLVYGVVVALPSAAATASLPGAGGG